MRGFFHILSAFAVIIMCGLHHPCEAAGVSDATAIVKILMFRVPPTNGETGLAVIYDKSDPLSLKSAQKFVNIVNSVETAAVRLKPFLADKTEAVHINADAAYLIEGTETPAVFENLARNNILSISSHDNCVKNGTCVLSITNTPKVRIKMNVAAAEKSNIRFQSVFRMMIQEY